jgi:hypothetical protein
MNENKIPELSNYAETDWSIDELDNLIENESGYTSSQPTVTTSSQTSVESNNVVETVHPNSNIYDPLQEVLEEETKGIDANLTPNTTITPQQTQKLNHDFVRDDNAYVKAFELMADLDLIRLPDNVPLNQLNLETLIQLKEETLDQQYAEVYDDFRNRVSHDPYMLTLLDYSYQGGKFVDLPRMMGLMQKEIDYRTVNLNNQDNQKAIVKNYLSLGLNPNNDKDRRILEMIPSRLENLIKNKTLRDEAEIARRHFVGVQEEKKRQEYARVLRAQEQEHLYLAKMQDEELNWENDFRTSLTKKNWSDERKESVKREYDLIRLNNGETVPAWQYKQEVIFSNPSLFQHFLDFTAKFNINTNSFNERSEKVQANESAINKLIANIQNKSRSTMQTNNAYNRPVSNTNNRLVSDPRKDEWL